MTGPTALHDAAQQHSDLKSTEYERQRKRVFDPISRQAAMLHNQLIKRWPEKPNLASFRPDIRDIETGLKDAASTALANGADNVRTQARLAGGVHVGAPPTMLSTSVLTAIEGVAAKLFDQRAKAIELLKIAESLHEAELAMAALQSAATIVDTALSYVIEQSSQEPMLDMVINNTLSEGYGVWQAERDACIECLCYAGQESHGEGFDPWGELTSSNLLDGAEQPPLHPNCRCEIVLFTDELRSNDTNNVSLPEAYQREAERSILKGWAGGESNAAKVKAAQELLTQGTNLPKSVQRGAQTAIKVGHFPPPPKALVQ